MSTLQYCPTCEYYLYLDAPSEAGAPLRRICRSCGVSQIEDKGGLITEIKLQEKVSEGYKVLLNEFTRLDPTLPHVDNIKCKNASCATLTKSAKPDVIYIKYDSVNMKFLYICNVCKEQWHSRT
jgi:DNA-directed RNA polymerase subunit M/transcription elongation factor TFIIS